MHLQSVSPHSSRLWSPYFPRVYRHSFFFLNIFVCLVCLSSVVTVSSTVIFFVAGLDARPGRRVGFVPRRCRFCRQCALAHLFAHHYRRRSDRRALGCPRHQLSARGMRASFTMDTWIRFLNSNMIVCCLCTCSTCIFSFASPPMFSHPSPFPVFFRRLFPFSPFPVDHSRRQAIRGGVRGGVVADGQGQVQPARARRAESASDPGAARNLGLEP